MAQANKSYSIWEIAGWAWSFTSDAFGSYSHSAITSAAVLDSARSLREIASELRSIRTMMNSLGTDGIHAVIREQAKQARRLEKLRLLRRKRERNKRLREAA